MCGKEVGGTGRTLSVQGQVACTAAGAGRVATGAEGQTDRSAGRVLELVVSEAGGAARGRCRAGGAGRNALRAGPQKGSEAGLALAAGLIAAGAVVEAVRSAGCIRQGVPAVAASAFKGVVLAGEALVTAGVALAFV